MANAKNPDLLSWHLEHDGVRSHHNDVMASYDRGGEMWDAAIQTGRELEAYDQAVARTNRAAFWVFIGLVIGALLGATVTLEYCARQMEAMMR